MLQLCHLQTTSLVDDLKSHDATFAALRFPINDSFGSTALTTNAGQLQSLTTMLEVATEELFAQYIEGQRYLDIEVRSLSELYSSYLARFTKYHVSSHVVALLAL
jgi:exocyst complex component 5